MFIALNDQGVVVNHWMDDDDPDIAPSAEWYPGDTRIRKEQPDGSPPRGNVPPRISRFKQADDWPERAARTFDETLLLWVSTGDAIQKLPVEAAIDALEADPLPAPPAQADIKVLTDTVRDLRVVVLHIVDFLERQHGPRFFNGG